MRSVKIKRIASKFTASLLLISIIVLVLTHFAKENLLAANVTKKWGENSNCDYTNVTEDNYLDEYRTTYNMGATDLLRIGDVTGSRAYRILMKFDFSNIPVTCSDQIASAYLKVKSYDNPVAGNIDVDAFRVKKNWNGGSSDYAEANDATDESTWTYQYYNETQWANAGCNGSTDRSTSSDDVETVSSNNTWYSWSVTDSVKYMYSNNEYFGWILKAQSEASAKYWRLYGSNHATASNLPYLEITYDTSLSCPCGGFEWWDSNYLHRKLMTMTAPASKAIPSGYLVKFSFDHASLVSGNRSQADGDDIRIVYYNGCDWVEADRVLFNDNMNSSSWNQTDTTIMFKTQAAISAGEPDYGYYLYYDNASASNPPASTLSSRYFLAQSLSETTTSSTTYSSKVQLQFTPSATSERWVVVSTWRQRELNSPGARVWLGKGRVRLNGTVRTGNDMITYSMSGDVWKTFAVLFLITGTTSQQTVNIDFGSYDTTNSGIDKARILAFMIPNPSSADIQYAETLSKVTDTISPTDAQTLTFSPSSAGDYIWLANGFFHEGPGGATNGGLFAEDENGIDQQNSGESYIEGSDGFIPLVHFEKRNLTSGSKTFTVRHQPDTTSGSDRQGLTQIAFRADVFDAVETSDSATQSTTTSTSYQEKVSLTTASQSLAHDYIYLVSMMEDDASGGSLTLSSFAEIRLNSAQQIEEEKAIERSSYDSQIAWAWAENTTGNRTIDARYKAESGVTAEAQYAHAIALRYIEPSMSLGDEQEPTAIDLISFTATGDRSSVFLDWETAQETDNAGFYLYRATSEDGPYTRLNDQLIPGHTFTLTGNTYTWEDTDVTPWVIYYYKLEDLDIYGNSSLHGPICVDWDGDGMPDDWEIEYGLDPTTDDSRLDPDEDGLSNLEEYELGLDPQNPDTDEDGILDGNEGSAGGTSGGGGGCFIDTAAAHLPCAGAPKKFSTNMTRSRR